MILSKSLVLNVNRFLQKVKDNSAFIAMRQVEQNHMVLKIPLVLDCC